MILSVFFFSSLFADSLSSQQQFISTQTKGFFKGNLKENVSQKYDLTSCNLTFEKGTEVEPKTNQVFNNEVFAVHLLGTTPSGDSFLESVIFKRISKKKLRSFFRDFKKLEKKPLENEYGYSEGEGQWVNINPTRLNIVLEKQFKIDTAKSNFFKDKDIVHYELTLNLKRISGDDFDLKDIKVVGKKKSGDKEKFEKVIDVSCQDIMKETLGDEADDVEV